MYVYVRSVVMMSRELGKVDDADEVLTYQKRDYRRRTEQHGGLTLHHGCDERIINIMKKMLDGI